MSKKKVYKMKNVPMMDLMNILGGGRFDIITDLKQTDFHKFSFKITYKDKIKKS